jgi:chaperonin cofactor prefoldin
MFFTLKHKVRVTALEQEISFLRMRVDLLATSQEEMVTRIERLEAARWGMKIDGTPKAKPGRKAKS